MDTVAQGRDSIRLFVLHSLTAGMVQACGTWNVERGTWNVERGTWECANVKRANVTQDNHVIT